MTYTSKVALVPTLTSNTAERHDGDGSGSGRSSSSSGIGVVVVVVKEIGLGIIRVLRRAIVLRTKR